MLFFAWFLPSLLVKSLLFSPRGEIARIKERGSSAATIAFGHDCKYLSIIAKGQGVMHGQEGSFFIVLAQANFSSADSKLSMHIQGNTNVLPETGPVPLLSFFVLARIATILRVNFGSAFLVVNSLVFAKSTSY